jgi:hypothetical protein
MKKRHSHWVIIFIIISMVACVAPQNNDLPEGLDIPREKLNTMIRMELLPPYQGYDNYKIDEPIFIKVKNLTETPVFFSESAGVKLYISKEGKWIEIANKMQNLSDNSKIIPKSQDRFGGATISIVPDVLEELPVQIRVIVVGDMKMAPSNSGEKVGAFVDFRLCPSEGCGSDSDNDTS